MSLKFTKVFTPFLPAKKYDNSTILWFDGICEEAESRCANEQHPKIVDELVKEHLQIAHLLRWAQLVGSVFLYMIYEVWTDKTHSEQPSSLTSLKAGAAFRSLDIDPGEREALRKLLQRQVLLGKGSELLLGEENLTYPLRSFSAEGPTRRLGLPQNRRNHSM